MRIYDLAFTDGKKCRFIVPLADISEQDELRGLQEMFCGRLASMVRIIAPAPTKLPWKRQTASLWVCGLFSLTKLDSGDFHCFWPGGEITGGKDEVSAAVRKHWNEVNN